MNSKKEQFLNLKTAPARLNTEETAWFLGFSPHEIPILIAEGLLKPLGRPPRNGMKYFASASLEELRGDVKWLARASDAVVEYWKTKNAQKKTAQRVEAESVPSVRDGLSLTQSGIAKHELDRA